MALNTAIVSSIPGRLRLRHPLLRRAQQSGDLAAKLRAIEGVLAVDLKPAAGSLLVHYDRTRCDCTWMETQVAAASQFGEDAEGASSQPARRFSRRSSDREWNRLAKLGMIASLPVSLALAAAGSKKLHAIAGGVFTLLLLVHLAVHRRHLVK